MSLLAQPGEVRVASTHESAPLGVDLVQPAAFNFGNCKR